ncbi:hypothetical protein [Psychromonas ossibalaenae]|uniref:hypothetical protein n=1 Tax=Psychromonas ossibalaenae TaxID=444922 RepID=UPI0012F9687A|nr:hypothetical protein [Psychromonas ossibalaenae]
MRKENNRLKMERDILKKVAEDNYFSETDGEHGRINQRNDRLLPISDWFDETKKWQDSFAVVEV